MGERIRISLVYKLNNMTITVPIESKVAEIVDVVRMTHNLNANLKIELFLGADNLDTNALVRDALRNNDTVSIKLVFTGS